MKKQLMVNVTCSVVLTALIGMAAGCASSAYNKAGSMAVASDNAVEIINKGSAQIDVALTVLSDMINNPGADLKPQFDQFMSATKRIESLADDVFSRASTMKSQSAAYFQQWDAEITKIQNEDIRKRSAERKESVVVKFNAMSASSEQVKTDFAPFMSDIKDIRTALSADLTTGGVSAVKGAIDKANKDAAALRKSLNKLAEEFKDLGVSLSASAPQTPAR